MVTWTTDTKAIAALSLRCLPYLVSTSFANAWEQQVRELACQQPAFPDNRHMKTPDCKTSSIGLDRVQEVRKHACHHPSPRPTPPNE